jgi:N6-adenosine-specific RNA methylase IME4
MTAYKCICADPPWNERGGGKCKRGADKHYGLMTTADIVDTMLAADKWNPAEDCHLWLWVTNTFLPDGLEVMKALGFRYVTNLCWGKDKIGLGQYLRGQHELCLFGVRGKAMVPDIRNVPSLNMNPPAKEPCPFHADVDALFNCPKGAHSQKPQYVMRYIERVSTGPRLEMFCRTPRDGWDCWGNQTEKHATTLF